MRLVIADTEHEFLLFIINEKLERTVRYAMGEAHIRRPRGIGAGFGLAGANAISRRKLSEVVAHVVPIFGVPSVGRTARAEIIHAVEMPFADERGVNKTVMEALAYRMDCIAERHAVAPDAVCVRE